MSVLLSTLIDRFPALAECEKDIQSAYDLMLECYDNNGKLLCCGNGGSAADCDHLVGELMKGFLKKRPLSDFEKEKFDCNKLAYGLQKGLPAISLCAHSALMTAFANDESPEFVFAQQVYAYAKKGDILVAFSTSGNSANVVYAVQAAKASGINVISLTGKKESKLGELSDVCIRIPETETFKIQELTLPVYHCLAAMIEENYFEV
jgi:D-sedoheptulose 7-phosphate isomerase